LSKAQVQPTILDIPQIPYSAGRLPLDFGVSDFDCGGAHALPSM
jgi:hypothetical protein